jgi:hypothetical protein
MPRALGLSLSKTCCASAVIMCLSRLLPSLLHKVSGYFYFYPLSYQIQFDNYILKPVRNSSWQPSHDQNTSPRYGKRAFLVRCLSQLPLVQLSLTNSFKLQMTKSSFAREVAGRYAALKFVLLSISAPMPVSWVVISRKLNGWPRA